MTATDENDARPEDGADVSQAKPPSSSPVQSPTSLRLSPTARPQGPRAIASSPKARKGSRENPGSSHTQISFSEIQPEPIQDAFSTSASTTINREFEPQPEERSLVREPEVTIEPVEDQLPGYAPGVVAEHPNDNDYLHQRWPTESSTVTSGPVWSSASDLTGMDVDVDSVRRLPDRPQIGPGVLPRRLLELIHPHELFTPDIVELPPAIKRQTEPPAASGSVPSGEPAPFADAGSAEEELYSIDDVLDALPGGKQNFVGTRRSFFCVECWSWIQLEVGYLDDRILDMDAFAADQQSLDPSGADDASIDRRRAEWARFNDLKTARLLMDEPQIHLHSFPLLASELSDPDASWSRIERIQVQDPDVMAFPHITFGIDSDPAWGTFVDTEERAELFLSCANPLGVYSNGGVFPGQIPAGLVKAFTAEKMNSPNFNQEGPVSAYNAWNLIAQ